MDVTRREFLSVLVLAGCKSKRSPTAPTIRITSPIGYSNVQHLTPHGASELINAGLTLAQVESVAYEDQLRSLTTFRAIADIMRSGGGSLILTVVNWNSLWQRSQTGNWFRDRVRAIREIVGESSVWLEGVSEPDRSAKALQWQQIAEQEWPGMTVVNGPGGRGSASVLGDFLDWHYCDYADLLRNVSRHDRIHSTDCTPILASNLSELEVMQVTRKAFESESILILYDTNNSPSFNSRVVKWMSDAIRTKVIT